MAQSIHKRVGRHARNFHKAFTKYLYERDTIFATIWVFVFIIVLGSIPLNLTVLNPLKQGLKDFDFSDMTYSKLGKGEGEKQDPHIVIINTSTLDREGIAMLIEKTASMGPKVMGLDVLFDGPKDPATDSLLAATIRKYPNLVLASKREWENDSSDIPGPVVDSYFKGADSKQGYVNFFVKDFHVSMRDYSPFVTYKGTTYPAFSTSLVREYDSSAYHKLESRHKKKELINYSRTVNKYQVIQPEDLFMDNVDDTSIRGKIALLGHVDTDPNNIEDKFFTPMNPKYIGKSVPDMNGIVVHANIISMVLEKNYLKKLPSWVNWVVAILICWLHMSFFIRYYLESHIWFHLVAKIAQVLSAFFFVWLGVFVFDRFRIKLDMKLSLIVIVMAVDVIYFYEAFAVWIHKKFNYHTVFHQKHH